MHCNHRKKSSRVHARKTAIITTRLSCLNESCSVQRLVESLKTKVFTNITRKCFCCHLDCSVDSWSHFGL